MAKHKNLLENGGFELGSLSPWTGLNAFVISHPYPNSR